MKQQKCEQVKKNEKNMEPDIIFDNSICSCKRCDSFTCFTLRNKKQCLCNNCKTLGAGNVVQVYNEIHSQTVKLDDRTHKRTNTVSKSSTKNEDKIDANIENIAKERFKKEITYEYSNDNFVTKDVKKESRDSISKLHDGNKDCVTPDVHCSRSATFAYASEDITTDTVKLSAQIMNMPYKEFKESILHSKSQATNPKVSKLTKYDILRRIKEAYDACSCKVCECIVGKSAIRNENCKCKPCECEDCTAFTKKLHAKKANNNVRPSLGCPCNRCDGNCNAITKDSFGGTGLCDCEPYDNDPPNGCPCIRCDGNCKAINHASLQGSGLCDCEPYKGVHFLTSDIPCDCRPCECIECKTYAVAKPITTIVGRIREEVPRNCTCTPCECAECGQNFPLASSLRHEMSTGINRPTNCTCENCMNSSCEANDSDTCTCQIQKRVMRKPVEKDTQDYDIHSAFVKNKSIVRRDIEGHSDTIAMFATVKNNNPRLEHQSCSCSFCECIVCSCKDKTATAIKASKLFEPISLIKEGCDCEPCECEICNAYISYGNINEQHDESNDCSCKGCDCLKCENSIKASVSFKKNTMSNIIDRKASKSNCTCKPCECNECQLSRYNFSKDYCHTENSIYEMYKDKNNFIKETIFNDKRNNYIDLISFESSDSNDYSTPKYPVEDNYLEKPFKEWKIIQINKQQNINAPLPKSSKDSVSSKMYNFIPKSFQFQSRFHNASKKSRSASNIDLMSNEHTYLNMGINTCTDDLINNGTQASQHAVIAKDVGTLTLPKTVLKNNTAMQTEDIESDSSVETTKDALSSYAVSKNDFHLYNKDTDVIGRNKWSILQKNVCFNNEYFRINSEQSEQCEEETRDQYGNKALLKLQKEIKKLMDIKLLPSSDDSYFEERSEGNSKSNSKCDSYKVKALTFRKISDNTVLMKWKLPLEVHDILAYELLVDGRTVQKMSPSRCMAVVSCLPNVDKLVMTVRTLLSFVPNCGHYPSATAVYNPRARIF